MHMHKNMTTWTLTHMSTHTPTHRTTLALLVYLSVCVCVSVDVFSFSLVFLSSCLPVNPPPPPPPPLPSPSLCLFFSNPLSLLLTQSVLTQVKNQMCTLVCRFAKSTLTIVTYTLLHCTAQTQRMFDNHPCLLTAFLDLFVLQIQNKT